MKFFNGRKAAKDYMSSNTLDFSTPERTLLKFSKWLAEPIQEQGADEDAQFPRILAYVESKDQSPTQVVDDDKFEPTGAIAKSSSSLYGDIESKTTASTQSSADSDVRFCAECGAKNPSDSKFCAECGTQVPE